MHAYPCVCVCVCLLSLACAFTCVCTERMDFPAGQTVKNLPPVQETQVQSLGQEDPLEESMQPAPVCLPGKSHGQRSLVGYSPCSHTESDMTEKLTHMYR